MHLYDVKYLLSFVSLRETNKEVGFEPLLEGCCRGLVVHFLLFTLAFSFAKY